jgi:hypothetical protein
VKPVDKVLILKKMEQRLKALDDRMMRDYSGGVQSDVYTIRELKYWKEAIERGEFDAVVSD